MRNTDSDIVVPIMFIICMFFIVFVVLIAGNNDIKNSSTSPTQAVATPNQKAVSSAETGPATWLSEGAKEDILDQNQLRKNIYLVLDSSGSMADGVNWGGERKIEVAKRAINLFCKSVPTDTNLGLLIFDNQGVSERVPLGTGEANRKAFLDATNAANPDNGTPLSSAIDMAYSKLRQQAKRQLGYGEYHLVVVTDGEANLGYDPGEVVNKILSKSPIVIHTIGFCISGKHSLNQPGRIIYKEANDSKGLEEGLQSVLAESEKFDSSTFDKK